MTNTLEQDIAELDKKAHQIAKTAKMRPIDSDSFRDFTEGFKAGQRVTAKEALSIIEILQEDRDRYKLLWESANVIVTELEEKLRIATACVELFALTGHVDAISTLKELKELKAKSTR